MRLLHEVLRMGDYGSHELKRGEHMFGDTRAAALAPPGDKEGALVTSQEERTGWTRECGQTRSSSIRPSMRYVTTRVSRSCALIDVRGLPFSSLKPTPTNA